MTPRALDHLPFSETRTFRISNDGLLLLRRQQAAHPAAIRPCWHLREIFGAESSAKQLPTFYGDRKPVLPAIRVAQVEVTPRKRRKVLHDPQPFGPALLHEVWIMFAHFTYELLERSSHPP